MENLKALLVDDEDDFASTLAERLTIRGVSTATALTGEAALEILRMDPPHIVVADLMMPGMSGLELLKHIKELWPLLPVILLTGRGSMNEATQGMELGAFDYLMKPIDIEELIQKMRKAVASGSSEGET